MARAIWTDDAEEDLKGIAWYIVHRDLRRAASRRLTREIHDKCNHYAQHPLTGTARPDLGEGCRVFSHSRWVVVFRQIDQGIEVLRVFDGSQDYENLF